LLRIAKAFPLLVLAIILWAGYHYSYVLRLIALPYSDLRELNTGMYVDPDLGEQRVRQLLDTWRYARDRIQRRFGEFAPNPVLVVTMHQPTAARYGLIGSPGIAYALPWQHYIVVRWKEDFVDLLAHELMHAQVRRLVGYPSYLFDMPTWLDEGIAMQVDDRARYGVDLASFAQNEIERVTSLDTAEQFWGGGDEQTVSNYRAAKAAVAIWLRDHPDANLRDLIAAYVPDRR
jgi:hypothetical protein